jgi:hypothetical protein
MTRRGSPLAGEASASAPTDASYLGGSGIEEGRPAIAVDGAGNIYVTGRTSSTNFPTANAFQPAFAGGFSDAFVTKIATNQGLVADAADQRVLANAVCQGEVTLDGTGSSDPDGDALTYTWSGDFGTLTGATPEVTLPLGTHTITLTVDDGRGGTATDTVDITVADGTPPTIETLTVSPGVLWPPNHQMAPIALTVNALDNCSAVSCKIVSVSSSEPVIGVGSGQTSPDWEVTGALGLKLRAERSGTTSGRIYTVIIQCTDTAALTATRTVTVTVPHNQ